MRGLPELRRAWVGGLVGLLAAAPPALLLGLQLRSPDAIVKHPESMNIELAAHNAVDPRSFLAPFGFQSVDLADEGFLHSGYVGLLALILAAMGVRWGRSAEAGLPKHSSRLWPLAAALCALFALGPFLFYDGSPVLISGARLRLPWWGSRPWRRGWP